MKFALESKIKGVDFKEVYRVFDFKLLKALSPPFMKPEAIVYDGNKKGDRLIFKLKNPLFTSDWIGYVSEEEHNENEIYFVDCGKSMPFGLKTWEHKHRLIRTHYGTLIRDEVQFVGNNSLITFFLVPLVWLQFLYRKPMYGPIIKNRLLRCRK